MFFFEFSTIRCVAKPNRFAENAANAGTLTNV